jgi:dephospho-CoA kinase
VITIVLTGGIASGKTAVSDHFATMGVPVIDTDKIAREIVEPGQPALDAIADILGKNFLLPDGGLDRSKLRAAIFSDSSLKSRLEAILHPAIVEEVSERINLLDTPYCILVIPLFVESSSYKWVDHVLVVDVPEEVQLERVMARDCISREQARTILRAQASRQDRLAVADDVINNDGSISDLQAQVDELHRKYLGLAAKAT